MTGRELARLSRAIVTVLRDSERTEEIHVAEELTGRERMRRELRALESSEEGRRLLADKPELRSDQVDFERLRALPAGTFGRAYIDHLDAYGLQADSQATPTRFIDDPELSWLMRRFRQTHDVWHALTGLGAEPHNEVLIHAFSLGQLHLPVSWLIVVFGGIKHLILESRWDALRHQMLDAYRKGRHAAPLMRVRWEDHWEEPVEDVRRQYGIEVCAA